MFDRLDTLIAFATVMLGVSLMITVLNQMIASLLGHRAMYLKDGIKDLLETLDPALKPHLEKIANDVLTHKLASDSVFVRMAKAPKRWKLAGTVRPEELAKLLKLVSTGQPYAANIQAILDQVNPTVGREAPLLASTVNALAPTAAGTAEQLIKEYSEKATKAIGRLESAFNSTMDRVRQRFTLQMRVWTIVFSLLFVLVYQLDAFKIYSQLSTDPALRASLSNVSTDLMKKYTDVTVQPPAGAVSGDQAQKNLDDYTKKLAATYKDVRSQLAESKLALFELPDNWSDWKKGLERTTVAGSGQSSRGLDWGGLLRLLATAGFLSLGAPFWYNTLKGLMSLRSQVADPPKKS